MFHIVVLNIQSILAYLKRVLLVIIKKRYSSPPLKETLVKILLYFIHFIFIAIAVSPLSFLGGTFVLKFGTQNTFCKRILNL